MLAQKGAGALVHAKQYDYVVFMQDVVLYNFIVLLGMIMIEYGLCLLVLEKLQRNKRKTLVCHEHIDTTERMAVRDKEVSTSCSWKESSPSPRGLNIEKENPSVLRRMDKVYCSDFVKSVVSIIRMSVDYSQLPALLLAVSKLPIIKP